MSRELLGSLCMNAGFEKTNHGKCKTCKHRTEPAMNGLLLAGGGFCKVTCDSCKNYSCYEPDNSLHVDYDFLNKEEAKHNFLKAVEEARSEFSTAELIALVKGDYDENKITKSEEKALEKLENMLKD